MDRKRYEKVLGIILRLTDIYSKNKHMLLSGNEFFDTMHEVYSNVALVKDLILVKDEIRNAIQSHLKMLIEFDDSFINDYYAVFGPCEVGEDNFALLKEMVDKQIFVVEL